MPRIPFAKQSYQLRSRPLDAERLINLYSEQAPADALAPVVIKPTPGLRPEFAAGTGPIRAMAAMPGRIYLVSGTDVMLVEPAADGTERITALGSVPATDIPTIAIGPTQVVVCAPPGVWVAAHGQPLNRVDGGQFPASGASAVVYLDGYFVFTAIGNSAQFFVSALLDAETTDPLDFAFADSVPNVVRRVVVHDRRAWMIGEAAIEPWFNSGDTDFPFRPAPGGVLTPGTIHPGAAAIADGSVFWVGTDGVIYRNAGLQATRVSTFAIERMIAPYISPGRGQACAYTWQGHAMVPFTFTGTGLPGLTVEWDCATKLWHERTSDVSGIGPWRGMHAGQRGGVTLIGDRAGGILFQMDGGVATDGGETVPREATLPVVDAHGPRLFMSRFAVEMEVGTTGAPGDVQVSWSDDGGLTWSPDRTLLTGAFGAGRHRVFTTRLGSFRRRVMRLRCDGRATFWAAVAEIEAGVS